MKIPSRTELVKKASTNGTIVVNPVVKKNERNIIASPTFLDIVEENSSASEVFSKISQGLNDKIEEKGVLVYGTYSFVMKMNTDLKNLCTRQIEDRMRAKKLKVD